MKRLAFAVALLIGLATPSQADYQAGVAAYERGDYATALREFRSLAEQGNSDAQVVQTLRPLREGEKACRYLPNSQKGIGGHNTHSASIKHRGRAIQIGEY